MIWTISIITIKEVYQKELGYANVEHVYILEPKMNERVEIVSSLG